MNINPLAHNPLRTRGDVQRAAADLFAPLVPWFSSSGARVRLSATAAHFDQAAAELEGFTRPLWAIAPLVAGGGEFNHWALYRAGLDNGTNPEHPDYWGDVGSIDQRQVEMAAVGVALTLCRQQLWEPQSPDAKARISAYLLAARDQQFVNSNWKFFRVMIDLGLISCGAIVDAEKRSAYLDEIEGFAIGNGWYRDGPIRSTDHYVPFAFHYYGLIYARHADDPARVARFRERAMLFAQAVRHWYAPDGSALPFGRSLSYRFAHAGFWGALAYAGLEALPWGEIKGYYLRNLRWWASQPIFERDGILSIGYAYPNLLVSEGYNSAASPYWAMKAFLPLALPDDHPFWAEDEQAVSRPEAPVPVPEPGMVIQHLPGHTVALTSGQYYSRWRGTAEKYAKFAYSTRYGFSIEANERHFPSAACDSMLVVTDDGFHLRMRETCEAAEIAGDCLYSRWRPLPDVVVETWLVPMGQWQIRLHEVTTPRRLEVAEGGFAVAKPDFRRWQEVIDTRRAEVRTQADVSVIIGYDSRVPTVLSPLSNTNVMAARTLLPQLRGTLEPGNTRLACAVAAWPHSAGDLLGPAPECPEIADLRKLFAAEGRIVPVFDLST